MLTAASIVTLCGLGCFFFLLVGISAKAAPAPNKQFTDSMMVNSANRDKELTSHWRK
jgi:hypothetical protein